MARSAALNPASMPFFPGGSRAIEDDEGVGLNYSLSGMQEQDRASMSSVSISPTDRPFVKSSPSPPRDDGRDLGGVRFHQHSPPGSDWMRRSSVPRPIDNNKAFSPFDTRAARESSLSGSLDTASVAEEPHLGLTVVDNGVLAQRSSTPSLRHGLTTPSISIHNRSRSPYPNNVVVTSSSPVSSLGSGGQMASSIDFSGGFEAQLRASPVINDILERLTRCELSTREIHRDLLDVHRKVDILVERSLGFNAQPEFKDPFASSSSPPHSLSLPTLNGQRHSIAGTLTPTSLAPNQSDDITQISQRLNTLTSSVGQLLALQTHQHMQSSAPALGSTQMPGVGFGQLDVPPSMTPPIQQSNGSFLGHGLPNRPDLRSSSRTPNPPMRTWSAGSLDLPVRPSDGLSALGRSDGMLRDKRRSVSGLVRRESTGGDMLSGASPRDAAGPALSKWDQLALAPELLSSLAKFGVGPPNKIQQRALPFLLRGADIIAQAPPTQERIAAYVIPAIHVALVNTVGRPPHQGPIVVMISTTVDQATQAQRMIRDIGGPIGIRSALGVGSSSNSDLSQELRLLQQNMPHVICGTPQKLHALFTAPSGLLASQVRFLVLDEVDQLIARNLHDFIFNIVKLLPPPRSRPLGSGSPPGSISVSSLDSTSSSLGGRRYSSIGSSPNPEGPSGLPQSIERQTALFSNTVPQDVLNLATAIQLREPVRVLVRRDGNVTHADTNQGARGLRQFYLYLAFQAGGRSELQSSPSGDGLGIIGSGRGSSSAETVQAREWKLDALSDLFEDVEVAQAIVHVGGMTALETVVYKLATRGLETIPLHGDMNAGAKLTALNKFRSAASGLMRSTTKVLVVYDVQVKTPEVSHIPLVINYDLPKAVEEYAHRVTPAIAPSHSRAGVIVNFVTATGGDVEMLRSIECFYKIKCPEVPMSLRHIV
ncbi:hypothetical protein FA95DRAFT_1556691 [Auriscalpium vulgare]|uniref:Uncharacterized protein n=1 Tax=Auriscalpium vulgare TaxID=40419 RepID=A0ACB8S1B0_9AGAM|nr:hypothetical protein FA95DRAFT_1556691 [Auriscalpium vulgare]